MLSFKLALSKQSLDSAVAQKFEDAAVNLPGSHVWMRDATHFYEIYWHMHVPRQPRGIKSIDVIANHFRMADFEILSHTRSGTVQKVSFVYAKLNS